MDGLAENLFKDNKNIMKHNENHLYIAPHPLLSPYIAHYTISFPSDSVVSDTLTLIPDASGCMIFTFDKSQVTSKFWGATTRTVIVQNDVNDIPMRIFVEFLPGGAFSLTGLSQEEFTDEQLPLEFFNLAIAKSIEKLFEVSESVSSFIEGINSLFLAALFESEASDVVLKILPYIKKRHGALSVKEISELSFYSSRQLNRFFSNALGMNLKTYSRILRVNNTMEVMKKNEDSFAVLAQKAGYYDQSHFIHDFKSICGVNPTDYLDRMSVFYNEKYKF